MSCASVRFYGPLNDFLPRALEQAALVFRFDGGTSVRELLEALVRRQDWNRHRIPRVT